MDGMYYPDSEQDVTCYSVKNEQESLKDIMAQASEIISLRFCSFITFISFVPFTAKKVLVLKVNF